MAVPPPPFWVPSERALAPSVTSVTSVASDKGDNEMILGAVHRYPGICLTAEENPRKSQLGDRLMKRLCDWSYYIPPASSTGSTTLEQAFWLSQQLFSIHSSSVLS